MRWQGRERSTNIEDRRGSGSSGLGGGKKMGGILGFIVLLIGSYYGVDLSGLVDSSGMGGTSGGSSLSQQEEEHLEGLSAVVLKDTENTWQSYFTAGGQRYTPPTMVWYNGGTPTSCGTGQAAMGPFYCPNDRKVYLDLSFYNDMKNQLGAAGDTAFAYVIAHEVGHHVQNLLGILPKVTAAQQAKSSQANALSVKLELQADCFAGIWGYQAAKNNLLETGDLEEAFNAAEAVGDDRLQKRSQGYVVPDSFTHGTSAQRLAWFKRGLQSGDPKQCNTFAE
ncbi:neutral zinc metallopeptidase [Bisgaard Taxon 10/6]|uniref:KPN_02809 family neutral zinc metallopeptidase n=1 Tax=Exercitatus varius TaxID=67857 RepID=UPI00294B430D|nr:neutral zinc metallopeptidase [Exercitatus varius]MDG2916106.1 neutral zinc metallopeptidase [Exercitatus varius]MDG2943523.1 neutral zinc metallopeptidase [Exercitatus varius]MDG2947111.1 neutral zinc metallopeptidase [Exercitatus varius]MDG2958223.1 neutral zinc metallopeptidase [Exercitatus varius]MDG2959339.1 neutral zinc metallopeptidase [Exercitatus varius]